MELSGCRIDPELFLDTLYERAQQIARTLGGVATDRVQGAFLLEAIAVMEAIASRLEAIAISKAVRTKHIQYDEATVDRILNDKKFLGVL